MIHYKYTCDNCGSSNVLSEAWVNPNSNEISSWMNTESWCTDCNELCDLNTKITSNIINYKFSDILNNVNKNM